jgi:arylsulfatase
LYDIAADRTERDDRVQSEPALVEELASEWERWAERVGALPWAPMLERYAAAGIPLAVAEE